MIELTWKRADVSKYIDYKKSGYKLTSRQSQYDNHNPMFRHINQDGGITRIVTEYYRKLYLTGGGARQLLPDGPSFIIKDMAMLHSIIWTKKCSAGYEIDHRDDGPSVIDFNKNGEIDGVLSLIHI